MAFFTSRANRVFPHLNGQSSQTADSEGMGEYFKIHNIISAPSQLPYGTIGTVLTSNPLTFFLQPLDTDP